jgi:LPS sulfotransferase NodH
MPYFIRPQITPYVILFIERDGSTYLSSLLMSHPYVQAVYEQFAVMKQQGASANDQLQWAKGYLTPSLISRWQAVGFKTKLVDVLDLDGFAAVLKQKGCRIIQMRRRNFIKAVISRINARRLYEASGKWNLYNESDRMPPMEIDLAEFDTFIKEREQADQELDQFSTSLGLPHILIEYEDLLLDRQSVLDSLFAFLKVRNLPVQSKTLKHTSDDLRDVVLNFDELRNHYNGTVYENMFDEVIVQA